MNHITVPKRAIPEGFGYSHVIPITVDPDLLPLVVYFVTFTGEQYGGSLRYVRKDYQKLHLKACHEHDFNRGDLQWLLSSELWNPRSPRARVTFLHAPTKWGSVRGPTHGVLDFLPRDLPKELKDIHLAWCRTLVGE